MFKHHVELLREHDKKQSGILDCFQEFCPNFISFLDPIVYVGLAIRGRSSQGPLGAMVPPRYSIYIRLGIICILELNKPLDQLTIISLFSNNLIYISYNFGTPNKIFQDPPLLAIASASAQSSVKMACETGTIVFASKADENIIFFQSSSVGGRRSHSHSHVLWYVYMWSFFFFHINRNRMRDINSCEGVWTYFT